MEYFTDTIECLNKNAPHSKEATSFYNFFKDFEDNQGYRFIRCFIAMDFFQKTEKIMFDLNFTIDQYKKLLTKELELAKILVESFEVYKDKLISFNPRSDDNDIEFTQTHYGNLFKNFSEYHYYEEPFELLSTRLDRNNIKLEDNENKIALDCGCGGGRYTLALAKFGFKEVYGVDYSPLNIDTAKERAKARNIESVVYKQGNVLDLPFEDNKFDFIFCNGVLHHSRSIAKGVEEMVRVIKPGGVGWLYLINRLGGIHLDTIELLRNILKPVDQVYARKALGILGIPQNRVFYILDHVMVPVNTLSSSEEIEEMFSNNQITEYKRLERGVDFDMIEKIWNIKQSNPNDKDLIWKYGTGEHRYLFRKP